MFPIVTGSKLLPRKPAQLKLARLRPSGAKPATSLMRIPIGMKYMFANRSMGDPNLFILYPNMTRSGAPKITI